MSVSVRPSTRTHWMGVWGKGQLEHVSDGELLNSTLWITFWRDYKMIFSIRFPRTRARNSF